MNDSAAMKEGEVGVGGDSVGGLCVCECVKICVCVPEDCICWRWWWGVCGEGVDQQAVSVVNRHYPR